MCVWGGGGEWAHLLYKSVIISISKLETISCLESMLLLVTRKCRAAGSNETTVVRFKLNMGLDIANHLLRQTGRVSGLQIMVCVISYAAWSRVLLQ